MQGSRILATLIALPIIAALIGLGSWQVQRLAWKADLIATMGERLQEAPMSLDTALALPPEDAEWRLVTTTGATQSRQKCRALSYLQQRHGGIPGADAHGIG